MAMEREKKIDGYKVSLGAWGKYMVGNPENGKFTWRKLPDEMDWDNVDECWEQIGHDIHDQNPDYYKEELGDPTKLTSGSEHNEHKHVWVPIREGRVPLIGARYTLVKCECGAVYPVPHSEE